MKPWNQKRVVSTKAYYLCPGKCIAPHGVAQLHNGCLISFVKII